MRCSIKKKRNSQVYKKTKELFKVIWRKAAIPPRRDRSVVFARWRQCSLCEAHLSYIHKRVPSKRHLDQFSRFSRAHRYAQHIHTDSGVAMGWAKSRRPPSAGAPRVPSKFKKIIFPVTVEIRTSGYQTLECIITLQPRFKSYMHILGCELHKNASRGRAPPGPAGEL